MGVFSSNGHTASPYTVQEDENTTDDTKPKRRTQTLHVMLSHRLKEVDRAAQVVLVILQGLALRLSYVLESGKVNDGLNIGIGVKHMIHGTVIQQRTLGVTTPHSDNVHEVQLSLGGLRYLLDRLEATDPKP